MPPDGVPLDKLPPHVMQRVLAVRQQRQQQQQQPPAAPSLAPGLSGAPNV